MKYLLFIFSLCFIACKQENKDLKEGYHISVSWNEIDSTEIMPFELMFDSIEVVKTPDVKKIPLGYISRIIQAGDYLAAVSKDVLVVLSRKDTTSYIYHKVGRGPGEYVCIEDVVFDEKNNHLLLLTNYPNRIFTLDLQCNFLSSYSLPYETMWERLFFHKDALYAFGEYVADHGKIHQDVVMTIKDNHLSDRAIITNRLLDGSMDSYWNIGVHKDELLLSIRERDSLFRISDSLTVTPLPLHFEHEKVLGINNVKSERMIYVNDQIMMLYKAADREGANYMKSFIYEFSTKKSFVYANLVYWGGSYVGFDQENVYYFVSPSLHGIYLKYEQKTDMRIRKIYKDVFKYLREGNEMDNPILVRFHIKQEYR